MAYGFKITDAAGISYDDSSFSLLSLGVIELTGEKTNHNVTVNLELPPDYNITVYPWISFRPSDTTIPTYTDNVTWKTLTWTTSKDITSPTYSVTYSFTIEYETLAKRYTNGTNSCMSGSWTEASIKAATKTSFYLVASGEY
jgi:hypothetical protein